MAKNIKSILLVDDDSDDRELFELALKKVAHSVFLVTADNGEDALRLLATSMLLPDLIFMDINMPGLSGFDTIKELQKDALLSTIPMVIYSTSTSESDINKAKQLGVVMYLNKPSRFIELCRVLKDFLD